MRARMNTSGAACIALALFTPCLAGPARADSVSALQLQAPPRQPWRFQGFPIVGFWGPPGTATLADFQAYKDAGFTLHATNLDSGYDQALSYVEAVGLKSLTMRTPGDFELPPRADPNPPADRASIVGWMLTDEPNGDADVVANITEMNRLMTLDPTRWTFFNQLPPNLQDAPGASGVIAAAVRNGMPIVSYDDYVIMADGSERTQQFYDNLATVRLAALTGGVPFWAFAVTTQHPGYAGVYRRPSESDLRWMQFAHLAYGAKGLWYFTYWGASSLPGFATTAIVSNQGAKSELYDMVRAINQTVLAVGDILLDLTSLEVVQTQPPPGHPAFVPNTEWIAAVQATDALIGFFVDSAGVRYAWVVNQLHGMGLPAESTSDSITLTFADDVAAVEAVSWLDGTPGPLPLVDRQAVLTVAGGTGVLLRTSP
jgi:hypothetical protein